MIYLISQVTFIFLTQIYYNMNFITLSSNFITRFPWYFKISLHWLLLEDNFLAHKKMHISEYACKTCLKKLGILLKCRETFEKFLAACQLFWKYWSSTFFPNIFWQLYFKNINFLTKTKKCLLCWLLWIQNYQMTGKYLTSNTTFSKKVNPMKYQIQTYILVRTWNLLSMYFTRVSN